MYDYRLSAALRDTVSAVAGLFDRAAKGRGGPRGPHELAEGGRERIHRRRRNG
jgi:hypothetical protein